MIENNNLFGCEQITLTGTTEFHQEASEMLSASYQKSFCTCFNRNFGIELELADILFNSWQ